MRLVSLPTLLRFSSAFLVRDFAFIGFNELYDLVVEDRACPQAAAVEKEFLDYCVKEGNKSKVGGRQSDEPTAVEGSASMLQSRYIRAAWDLNHDQ
jgi:hypothetical protein